MKGTAEQARDYCKKEDSRLDGPWSWENSLERESVTTWKRPTRQ